MDEQRTYSLPRCRTTLTAYPYLLSRLYKLKCHVTSDKRILKFVEKRKQKSSITYTNLERNENVRSTLEMCSVIINRTNIKY